MFRHPIIASAVVLASVMVPLAACQGKTNSVMSEDAHQTAALTPQDVTGLWRLVTPTGTEICLIALSGFSEPAGFVARIETCSVSKLSAVRWWRVSGPDFEMLTSDGQVAGRFRRTGVDSFVAIDSGYRLERAPIT